MALNNMGIGKKITLFGSIIVVLCVAVTALTCIWQVRSDLAKQANATLDTRLRAFWEMLLAKDTSLAMSTEPLEARIKAANIRVEDDKMLVGFYALNNDMRMVDQIKDLFGGTATIFMKDTRISTNVKNPDGTRATGTKLTGPAYDAVIKNGKPYRGDVMVLGQPSIAAYDPIKNQAGEVVGVLYVGVPRSDYFASLNRLMIMVGGVAVALIIVLNIIIITFARRFIKPLVDMVPTANKLAEGNLAITVEVNRKDEIGQLQQAMKDMVEKWRTVVADVKSVSNEVASAGEHLIVSAQEMTRGSADQASRSTQVATSAEEMSQTIIDMARNVNEIALSATDTAQVAKEGEDVVNRSVTEVQEIARTVEESATLVRSLGDRSSHIGEIVSVINDIADQTNLLALNAAIEAARAGEQGRGFAVVADEVRKLAERTAHATSEISGMIKAIQDEVLGAVDAMENASGKVSVGVELSSQAGSSLTMIVRKVDDLQLMVQQIASATEEMSATSEEISKDIDQIASVSKDTSVTAEQTNQAATDLSQLSLTLQKSVGEFTL